MNLLSTAFSSTRTMPIRFAFVVAIALLVVAGCRSEPDLMTVSETEEITVPLDTSALILEGYNGRIVVTGTRDTTATLAFEKMAEGATEDSARALLTGITIETDSSGIYDRRSGRRAYAFRVTSEAAEQTEVAIRARVPYQAPLVIEAGNATVEVNAVSAPIEIDVANGAVTVEGATHDIEVRSRNGDVSVAMAGFKDVADVRLRTGNGNLTLALPASVSGRLDAEAIVGDVVVEGLDITPDQEQRTATGKLFSADVGDGSGTISLRTENGTITVRGQ